MRYIFLIFFCFLNAFAKAQSIASFNNYLKNNNQVLFVKTPSYHSIHGTMLLYERKNSNQAWKIIDSFAVNLGRSGLAKDVQATIPFKDTVPIKQEGDGKSPSGIFKLGKVFSYHNLQNVKMPFVQVDTNFYCVDDVHSRYYNQLIVADTAQKDFSSFEHMKLPGNAYEYGIWVLYNSNPVTSGNGSCIFLHVWNDSDTATSGCTAMAKDNMLKLIHWLDEKKNPVLLQVANE